jgi:hypothetical protein
MPVRFIIDTKTSTVITTATGIVSFADIVEALQGKGKAGVHGQ